MPALRFPANPANNQIYPTPAVPNVGQWKWSSLNKRWEELPLYVRTTALSYNNYIWPPTAGEPDQRLVTKGDGNLEWLKDEDSSLQRIGILEPFDGISTSFSLVEFGTTTPVFPNPPSNIVAFLGGVPQRPGSNEAYTVVNSTITFTEAPERGTTFYAITNASVEPNQAQRDGTVGAPVVTVLKSLDVLEKFDGNRTDFTIVSFNTQTPYEPIPSANIVVSVGGATQIPNASYTVDGTTISFTEAPETGANFYAYTNADPTKVSKRSRTKKS